IPRFRMFLICSYPTARGMRESASIGRSECVIMVGEAIAGLGAVKTAFDLARGLKDISDATIRNGAIIELQEKILTAQQAQATLIERIDQLEKEVAGFEAWDAQK